MYGINLVEVAKILGAAAASGFLFGESGAIHSIYQEIEKYSALQNIAMVKTMMRLLSLENERVYKNTVEILREHFTEEEIKEILQQ